MVANAADDCFYVSLDTFISEELSEYKKTAGRKKKFKGSLSTTGRRDPGTAGGTLAGGRSHLSCGDKRQMGTHYHMEY